MKRYILLSLLVLFAIPVLVHAQTFKSGDSVVIDTVEEKDVYGASSTVYQYADVHGDLVVAGGVIVIEGVIDGDLIAAGGTIKLNGTVKDDVRIAGGTLEINGTIGDHLMAAGGEILIGPDASITNDAYITGGEIDMQGYAGGKVKLAGGDVAMNGAVQGDLEILAGEAMTFGSNASVGGNLKYQYFEVLSINESQVAGGIEYSPIEKTKEFQFDWFKLLLGITIYDYLSLLIIGLVLVLLFGKTTVEMGKSVYIHVGENLGFGLIFIIVAPILLFFVMITLLGIPLALFGGLVVFLLLAYTHFQLCASLGYTIFRVEPTAKWYVKWGAFALGGLIVYVVFFIPFIGIIAYIVAFLMTLGAVIKYVWELRETLLHE